MAGAGGPRGQPQLLPAGTQLVDRGQHVVTRKGSRAKGRRRPPQPSRLDLARTTASPTPAAGWPRAPVLDEQPRAARGVRQARSPPSRGRAARRLNRGSSAHDRDVTESSCSNRRRSRVRTRCRRCDRPGRPGRRETCAALDGRRAAGARGRGRADGRVLTRRCDSAPRNLGRQPVEDGAGSRRPDGRSATIPAAPRTSRLDPTAAAPRRTSRPHAHTRSTAITGDVG